MISEISNHDTTEQQKQPSNNSVLNEANWLQQARAQLIFKQLDQLLFECCKRLNATNKIEGVKTEQKSQTLTEKFNLLPRPGQDNLTSTVTISAENIVQAEVTLKYMKTPGYYRATANPEIQWKLQQLQDAANVIIRAIHTLRKGARKYDEALKSNKYDSKMLRDLLLVIFHAVKEGIKSARTSLIMPKKKSLVELCNFQPIKSFMPPLPHDILLSYYISSAKLVCAAYQVISRHNGVQTVTIYQAECIVPQLVELVNLLNSAFSVVHEFLSNYSVLLQATRIIHI